LSAVVDGILQRFLRPPVRELARRLLYAPVDLFESLTGRCPPGVPPRGLRFVGAGDYLAVGREFRDLLLEHCELRPSSQVLDVGCGIGRLAVPLTGVLSREGSYHGFDVSRPAIRWTSRHISRDHPNFHFEHLDVRNRDYNPGGVIDPRLLTFPWPDQRFDIAMAVSLFTHMLAEPAARYVAETARVLRPGGVLLATFFLLNDESRELIQRGLGSYAFRHRVGTNLVEDPRTPEAAVAHDENEIVALLEGAGLDVDRPILSGAWCGRHEFRSFQDVVVARRAG
jgi:SAM-dependent methyltransferase